MSLSGEAIQGDEMSHSSFEHNEAYRDLATRKKDHEKSEITARRARSDDIRFVCTPRDFLWAYLAL